MNIPNKFILLSILVSIFIQISNAHADSNAEDEETTALNNSEPAVNASPAQTAHIDPRTGQLIALPDTNLPAAKAIQESLPPIEMLTHSNGTVQLKLNGRFRTPLVAQIGCDGKIKMTHAENKKIETIECGESE